MLVEVIEVTPDTWRWTDTTGLFWDIVLPHGTMPVEAKQSKSDVKKVIKLKEAGFTAEEIIEMANEGVV